jgi:transcriptional regulator with XRE-family HTH domain
VTDSTWWAYVQRVAGPVQNTQIADRVGIDKSAITRWSRGNRPEADFAVRFARGYGRPPAEALAAAGYMSTDEAGLHEVPATLEALTSEQLAAELLERIRSGTVGASPQDESNVTPITRKPAADMTVDELEAQRKAATTDESDPRE